MNAAALARLRALRDEAGCVTFEVIRATKHVIVDFVHPEVGRARLTVANTTSDHRAFKNQLRDLRRAIREKKERMQ